MTKQLSSSELFLALLLALSSCTTESKDVANSTLLSNSLNLGSCTNLLRTAVSTEQKYVMFVSKRNMAFYNNSKFQNRHEWYAPVTRYLIFWTVGRLNPNECSTSEILSCRPIVFPVGASNSVSSKNSNSFVALMTNSKSLLILVKDVLD